MSKRSIVSLTISLILAFGLHVSVGGQSKKVEAEECAVYSAVINELYSRRRTSLRIAKDYLSSDIPVDSHYRYALEHNPGLDPKLLASYESRNNAEPYSLDDRLSVNLPYVLQPTRECQELWKRKEVTAFKAKCHGGGEVMALSRVGFSPDKTQALVRVEISCGGLLRGEGLLLCGEGLIVLLDKEKGIWNVSRHLVGWES